MVPPLRLSDREDERFNDGFNLRLTAANNSKGERDEGAPGDIAETPASANVLLTADVSMLDDFLNSLRFFFGCPAFKCESSFPWSFVSLSLEEHPCFLLISVDSPTASLARSFEISVVSFLIAILFSLIDLTLDGC